jgi:hypothetical protein
MTSPPRKAVKHATRASSPVKAQHFVPITWEMTVSIGKKGLFGNQNSTTKLQAKKWWHTAEVLATVFDEPL